MTIRDSNHHPAGGLAREWIETHLKPPSSDSIDEADGFTVKTPLIGPLHYWYRRRNGPLVPMHRGTSLGAWRSFGQVEMTSPPCEAPGEISIELDGGGRLVRFQMVPP